MNKKTTTYSGFRNSNILHEAFDSIIDLMSICANENKDSKKRSKLLDMIEALTILDLEKNLIECEIDINDFVSDLEEHEHNAMDMLQDMHKKIEVKA